MQSISTRPLPVEPTSKPTTQTFNSTWSMMKGMIIFFGVIMVITVVASMLFSYQANEIAQQRAYIITADGTLVAKSALHDLKAREVEVRGHVSLFMRLMYAFDERNFESNTELALHLIGDDGALIMAEYKKAKILEELIKTNGIISIRIDSVWTNMSSYPYKARVFTRQRYETSVSEIESVIWADMFLKNAAARDDKNLAGLIIENFNIVKNEPIESK